MNNITPARYGIDPYLDWVAAEGVPVFEGIVVNLKGRGDFGNMMLFDIPPGGSTTPLKHLYEDVIYVLEGRGNTEVEFSDGSKRSFEWGPKSLFAIPLNSKHRHFNASGQQRAFLATTTNLPLLLNAF